MVDAKVKTEATLTLNRQEAVFLLAIINAVGADQFHRAAHGVKEAAFPDINPDKLGKGFLSKVDAVIHENDWCPDPDCLAKKK